MESVARRLEAGVAVTLTLAAVWLRWIAATSAGGLWRDEANTVALSTLPRIRDVWDNLQYDSFPVLWLGIVRLFAAGAGAQNDDAFRALGFFVGVSLLAAVWVNARVFGYRFPAITLALIALSPSVIRWGDSMRAYGLGMFVILVTAAVIWRFVERPSPVRFLVATLAAVLSVQTLYYNAVLLLALCCGGFGVSVFRSELRVAAKVGGIGLVAALSLLPYSGVIRRASEWNSLVRVDHYTPEWFWIKFFEAVTPAGSWSFMSWILVFLASLTLGLAAVIAPTLLAIDDRNREIALFGVVTMIVGALGSFMFLKTLSYATQPWYYLTLMLIVATGSEIVLAAGLRNSALRVGIAAIALLIGASTLLSARQQVAIRMTNADIAALSTQALASSKDLVVVDPWFIGVSVERYYHGSAPMMTIPDIGFHKYHRYDLVLATLKGADTTSATRPALSAAEETLKSGGTVFILGWFSSRGTDHEKPRSSARVAFANHTYESQWSSDLERLIREHAISTDSIAVDSNREINRYETVTLTAARGWAKAASVSESVRSTTGQARR